VVKKFIETNHSCDDEQFEACTGEGRCVQIKKTRNSIVWVGVAIMALAYFLLIPGANQIKELSNELTLLLLCTPTQNLYKASSR